jgi:hypothetical protein
MGGYEHEKYTISKDVDCGSEFEAWKNLALKIIDFEADLVNYRKLCEQLPNVIWATQREPLKPAKEKANKQAIKIKGMIEAFRSEHKPVFKECKCYYCQNRGNYNQDYDENDCQPDLPF